MIKQRLNNGISEWHFGTKLLLRLANVKGIVSKNCKNRGFCKITKWQKHTSVALSVAQSLASVRSNDVVSGRRGFSRQTSRA